MQPIGAGDVLRRVTLKAIIMIFKKDITDSAKPLQLSAGQEAGAEAAIHATRDIFKNEDTEAVLLIDSENAFSPINQKVILHHLNFICPISLRIPLTAILHLQDYL